MQSRDEAAVEKWAEKIRLLMDIDKRRIALRRMAFFEEEHFTGRFHFQADVVNILSNPALQAKMDVGKVIEELRANPPYYRDDKELADSIKEALEKVEASLMKK